MSRPNPRLLVGTLAFALLVSAGCGTKAAEPSGFLAEDSKMAEQDQYPFQRAWFAPDWNNPDRSSIVIAPVNTAYVKKTDWWKEAEKEGKIEKLANDLNELAAFTQDEFQKAFRQIRNNGDVQQALDRAAAAIDQDIRDNHGYPFGEDR